MQFQNYVNNLNLIVQIIHDVPVSQREIITLRNKGLIVVKSMIFDFSNYVDYNRAMNIFNALRKFTTFCQTILHLASPNTFQYPINENPILFELNEYNTQLYHSYLNPSNLIPPFDGNISNRYYLYLHCFFKVHTKLLTHTLFILSFLQLKVLQSTSSI